MLLKDINPWFDFTSDTKEYWDNFCVCPWERPKELSHGPRDPDSCSQTMRDYHRLLWSRQLPNGEQMQLEDGLHKFYLRWKVFYFGSDSITATFRYYNNRTLIEKVKEQKPDYNEFIEDCMHRLYTIGGEMLFPVFNYSINQARGCHPQIRDRWDLTLECIKLFYEGKDNPLIKSLEKARPFFELFVDFKGFVDFFFLQDCVDNNYNVIFWLNTKFFESNPMPQSVEDYLNFVQQELDFVEQRNQRIANFIKTV